MFCPQCRSIWSKESAGKANPFKSKGKSIPSRQWGSALVCPNCLIPLAADRIQGEFPSVAHASSMKEGSMTIQDVLRESSAGAPPSSEVPLDDKKLSAKFYLFEKDVTGKTVLNPGLKVLSKLKQPAIQRLVMIGFAVSFLAVAAYGVRMIASAAGTRQHSNRAALLSASVVPGMDHPVLTATQQSLMALMRPTVGPWSRIEQRSDVLQDGLESANNTVTFLGSYRNGVQHVELWATTVPKIDIAVPLQGILASSIAVHTDRGTVIVPSRSEYTYGLKRIIFDYDPRSTNQWSLLTPTGIPATEYAHTVSWFQSPFVVTIASNSKSDRDNFVKSLVSRAL
jgi:hypothetical protein